MITKKSVVKIQNLVVNNESRPVKSNPNFLLRYSWFKNPEICFA